MKLDFINQRDIWGPLFTSQIQYWGKNYFEPALEQIKNGQLNLPKYGVLPEIIEVKQSTEMISKTGIIIEIMNVESKQDDLNYFDLIADEYEMAVKPFKSPILFRVFQTIIHLLPSNIKILDCACGPGYELISLANIAINGEVIGIDLSKEMIKQAYRNSKNIGLSNVGFYQCDAALVPYNWDQYFDMIFCNLSCSYFKDIKSVIKEHSRLVHSKGMVVLVEPIPNQHNSLSMDIHKASIPLFQRYYDQETFQEWYKEVGFKTFYWEEILPGIALYVFTK